MHVASGGNTAERVACNGRLSEELHIFNRCIAVGLDAAQMRYHVAAVTARYHRAGTLDVASIATWVAANSVSTIKVTKIL